MSDIDIIRDEKRTEDDKMELVANYLETVDAHPTLDSVLANGNVANSKTAKFKAATSDTDYVVISDGQIYGEKTTANGVSTFRLLPTGNFYVDFQPANGGENSLSTFQIDMNDGSPRVIMSDDVKAAFKAELGIE